MKMGKRAKVVVIAGSLCVLISIVFGSRLDSVSGGQSPQPDERKVLVQTLRKDGLRGAAKLKKHYVGEFDPHWDLGAFDIEALTKNSVAVVVAVLGRNLGGHLTDDGMMILTNYEVMVQEGIKGKVVEGSTIIVSLPGGRVEFEDGTTAELRTPKFEAVKTGGTYTFFLTEVEKSPGVYTATGGPQGIIEVVDNESVRSHGRDTDPVAKETSGKDKRTILKEIRKQAKKWPNKGKCCS
jgi:hypothetical protein